MPRRHRTVDLKRPRTNVRLVGRKSHVHLVVVDLARNPEIDLRLGLLLRSPTQVVQVAEREAREEVDVGRREQQVLEDAGHHVLFDRVGQ